MSPIPESPAARLRLEVHAHDAQSDILILDSKGRLVERGLGPVRSFDLERGIYRVKVVTGREVQERPVVLTQEGTLTVQFPPVAFASPVPLIGTSTSHEYHMAAADTESRKVHVRDGAGSSLFFLVRDWTPASKAGTRQKATSSPATGLTLHAVTGNGDRMVADIARSGAVSLDGDAWCACTVELDPGVYELRLELPTGDTLHQAIVAAPSWQTQSFVFMRGYATTNDASAPIERRADLARSSVIMSRQVGFSQDEPHLRLAELARVALATSRSQGEGGQDRRLVPDEVRTLLKQKGDNPMLGIYAAHLLLMETVPDLALLGEAVSNLRVLLGMPHPDVEALALYAERVTAPQAFDDPPMLRRSWSLIVDANVDKPDLVTDSLTERVTTDLWLQGPWHVWRTAAMSTEASEGDDLSDVEVALANYLGLAKRARSATSGDPDDKPETLTDALTRKVLSSLRARGVQTISSILGRSQADETLRDVQSGVLALAQQAPQPFAVPTVGGSSFAATQAGQERRRRRVEPPPGGPRIGQGNTLQARLAARDEDSAGAHLDRWHLQLATNVGGIVPTLLLAPCRHRRRRAAEPGCAPGRERENKCCLVAGSARRSLLDRPRSCQGDLRCESRGCGALFGRPYDRRHLGRALGRSAMCDA